MLFSSEKKKQKTKNEKQKKKKAHWIKKRHVNYQITYMWGREKF